MVRKDLLPASEANPIFMSINNIQTQKKAQAIPQLNDALKRHTVKDSATENSLPKEKRSSTLKPFPKENQPVKPYKMESSSVQVSARENDSRAEYG